MKILLLDSVEPCPVCTDILLVMDKTVKNNCKLQTTYKGIHNTNITFLKNLSKIILRGINEKKDILCVSYSLFSLFCPPCVLNIKLADCLLLCCKNESHCLHVCFLNCCLEQMIG